ncbi:hypothetical protein ETB97_010559 [Aspergillus alliaceus]|uniref:Uncharacterized protein n=1 Tax=Petromyces alliaceus TaxID=209559 RepID=A0A8H5ZTM1_PETAA|nr:hypothetical protein ETB97_010559 [Aspergillus burnettii]
MVKAVIEAPYNHHVYHAATQPSLRSAKEAFDSSNAQKVINTLIRDCFLKHNIEKMFSVTVLHRHFDLQPDERNVEEGGQAIASKDLDNINPCSWLFYDGKLFPYEFRRASPGQSIPPLPTEFVTDLWSILQAHGLCDILGFQTYTDGLIGSESTDKTARVSTTVDYAEEEFQNMRGVRASFAFFQ